LATANSYQRRSDNVFNYGAIMSLTVLSLFDGMSCGQLALQRANIKYDRYFASEIDKNAIKLTQSHYPNTIQLGDVRQIKAENLPIIDLLIGGSPCQGFSTAGKGLNFKDPRSKLFFEFVRLLKECQPRYFLLENVVMKKEWLNIISSHLNVIPIKINSALVSAQNRVRYYWTNIPNIKQPKDKYIYLQDILEDDYFSDRDKSYAIDMHYFKGSNLKRYFFRSSRQIVFENENYYNSIVKDITIINNTIKKWRILSVIECERLQTVPDTYTDFVSNTQGLKLLGNGWTVDVITHIFKNLNGNPEPKFRNSNVLIKWHELNTKVSEFHKMIKNRK